ncbi:hypothetical protein VNPA141581_45840 [Pseudomonas aeruginosa]|uniref:Putative aminoglycoside N(6')-acetyltransferase n=1 Tax=Pseudomonas aeruginosa TaxID=287 RepID=A0A8D5Y4B5_PSEAI|nr:putative aminoglycoside N(6')-acetyltransferase [Pseudomonas aeruginosa]GLF35819.1 hypothetical protein VNPA141581_45840 [Pseudomonas aeruginosa]
MQYINVQPLDVSGLDAIQTIYVFTDGKLNVPYRTSFEVACDQYFNRFL